MLAFIIRKPPSCILPPHIPDEPEICANSLPRLSARGGAACEMCLAPPVEQRRKLAFFLGRMDGNAYLCAWRYISLPLAPGLLG